MIKLLSMERGSCNPASGENDTDVAFKHKTALRFVQHLDAQTNLSQIHFYKSRKADMEKQSQTQIKLRQP